jgi:hypothetical protein
MPREIALFVPGTSGVCLRDTRTGRLSWGTPLYILGWRNYYPMQLPYRPGVEDHTTFGPVLDHVWFSRRLHIGIPFYEKCFRVLRERAGRRQGDLDAVTREADFYPWPFDWRRDLMVTVRRLDETVERLIDFHQDPDLKISLICHSYGALVARYWWAYGATDVCESPDPPPPDFPRRRNLGRLIHVGAPNQGTLKILYDMTNGITVVAPGRRYHADFLFSMPSLYETLPFDATGRFVDERGDTIAIDLLDPQTWYRWRLGAFTLFPRLMESEDARVFLVRTLMRVSNFQAAMRHPWPSEMVDTVHVLASRSYQTMRRLRLTPHGINLEETRANISRRRWGAGVDAQWVERGDWFAPWDSLIGLAHRPEHRHELDCIHRHLFSDPRAQSALVETLGGD